MKLFGSTSKKHKSGAPSAAENKKGGKSANTKGSEGLIGMLAKKRIEKAKKALDTEEYRSRSAEERRRIEENIVKYQRRRVIRRIVIIAVLLALVLGGIIFYKVTVRPPDIGGKDEEHITAPKNSKKPIKDNENNGSKVNISNSSRHDGMYTFVVIGNDQGNGNTDTMLVGRLDTVGNTLNVISIPRDTMVNVKWSVKKVNTILAFRGEGMEGLVEGLSDVLGFEVDSYISVDLEAFQALVNAIGGVYFDVPQNMNYWDPTQNLQINVSAGYQLLNGHDAMGVVRFRSGYAAGDIKRISVQQDFMKALAKQCLTASNIISNIDDYARIFKEYVETDLTVGNIVWYAQQMMKLDIDNITFQTMPENYNDSVRGLSYCTIYVDDWVKMINECLNPYKEPITADHLNILTRDSNGNLYATNGTIAGGIDSFYNNISSSSGGNDDDDEPDVTTDPNEGDEPNTGGEENNGSGENGENGGESGENGETAGGENNTDPPVSEPPITDTPENSDPPVTDPENGGEGELSPDPGITPVDTDVTEGGDLVEAETVGGE